MFQWLKTRLERRRLQDRGLFRYHDGTRTRYADPFVVWRALNNHPEMNLEKQADFVDIGQEPETTTVVKAFCDVFDVKRWDDTKRTGLMDWEILDLINQLEGFLAPLKKNISLGQTSSPPTESASLTGSEVPLSEVTSSSSASGSILNEPKPAKPTESCEPSQTASAVN
jgi:hypothetical protein